MLLDAHCGILNTQSRRDIESRQAFELLHRNMPFSGVGAFFCCSLLPSSPVHFGVILLLFNLDLVSSGFSVVGLAIA
jgi:hypothetical protein